MTYYSLHSNGTIAYLQKDIISYSNWRAVENNIYQGQISNTISLVRDIKMKFPFVVANVKTGRASWPTAEPIFDNFAPKVITTWELLCSYKAPISNSVKSAAWDLASNEILFQYISPKTIDEFTWSNRDGRGKISYTLKLRSGLRWTLKAPTPTSVRYPKENQVLSDTSYGYNNQYTGEAVTDNETIVVFI
jgi:hypothetical protein